MRGLLLALLLLFLPLPAMGQEPLARLEEHVIVSRSLPLEQTQTMSAQGVAFLRRMEGFSPTAYKDSKGYSIGYGFQTWQGRRVTRTYPRRVTLEQAEAELARQLPKYEAIVREHFNGPIEQHRFDALVSIAFNLGRVNSTIVAKIDTRHAVTVQDFVSSATVRRRPSALLFERRVREFMVFLGQYDAAFEPIANAKRTYRSLLSQTARLSYK